MRGKIVVFEGIDGSGKNTQAQMLHNFCSSRGHRVKLLQFPRYGETFFGREVGNYLNGEYGKMENIHPKFSAMLYAGDRFESREMILKELRTGTILIIDRYVSSNIAHQVAKVPDESKSELRTWIENLEYAIFDLPRPDLTIFLDMPPNVAKNLVLNKGLRTYTDKKLDLHEENYLYLEKAYNEFKKLSMEYGWVTINCFNGNNTRSAVDISNIIIDEIGKKLDLEGLALNKKVNF
jgi:dTMP kinase